MQLRFLGQTYTATPATLAVADVGIVGKYRGIQTRFTQAHDQTAATQSLTYRGIRYSR